LLSFVTILSWHLVVYLFTLIHVIINDCNYFTTTKGPIMPHCQLFNLRQFLTNNSNRDPSGPPSRLWCYWLMALLLFTPLSLQAQLVEVPNGAVNAIVKGADGTTYLGGAFTAWVPQTGGGALLGASDGAVNTAFPKTIGQIAASVADGSGGFYIGGTFTSVGGVARNNLAQIDSTGAVTSWNPNAIGPVYALIISGNTVYAGGGASPGSAALPAIDWLRSAPMALALSPPRGIPMPITM
jgi:hypothetical protein